MLRRTQSLSSREKTGKGKGEGRSGEGSAGAARAAAAGALAAAASASTVEKPVFQRRPISSSAKREGKPSVAPSRGFAKSPSKGEAYWDFKHSYVDPRTLGHTCRECRQPFTTLGEQITLRRGGRIELRYHNECFSGIADPRSQRRSSANLGEWAAGLQNTTAPEKRYHKMRTSSHW